jgi:hypothetical protein
MEVMHWNQNLGTLRHIRRVGAFCNWRTWAPYNGVAWFSIVDMSIEEEKLVREV